MIDKAAIVAAQEMVDFPNTHWDYPNKRDEVLAVARALLKAVKTEAMRRVKARAARRNR